MVLSIVLGIGATDIVAELRGDVSEAEATVDGPLLALTPAFLVAEVAVDIQVFTLPALALLPLEVVVAASDGRTDVPAVEAVVLGAVAEPVAQLYAEVHELLSVGVLVPCVPGPEELTLDTPVVGLAECALQLDVWSDDAPEEEVRLHCPDGTLVSGLLADDAGLGQVDDGVADDQRVAQLLFREFHDHCRTGATELWEVLGIEDLPHLSSAELAELRLARILRPLVGGLLGEDLQHVVLPRFITLLNHP